MASINNNNNCKIQKTYLIFNFLFVILFSNSQALSLTKFCTNPPNVAHTFNPKQTRTPIGNSINYTCNPNFHAFGVTIAICTEENQIPKWIGPDMTCEKMCGKLPSSKKAYATITPKLSYPPFTEVLYRCKYGRLTLGSAKAICRAGKWKPPSFLCIKQCGIPPKVPHATFYASSSDQKQFREMSKVQYKCSKGYQQIGLSEAWCYHGKWRGPALECKVNRETLNEMCGEPGYIENGYARVENSPVRHIIYSCAEGMELIGSEVQSCNPNGTWDHNTPTCSLKTNYCGLPPVIQDARHNASLNRPAYANGDVLAYTCIPGFFHLGHHLAKCNGPNATWIDLNMTCKPKRCNPPPVIRGGHIEGSEFTYRSRIHFHCNSGHKLIGRESLVCQENGTWDGSIPSCEPLKCPLLLKPDKGSIFGKNLYGSIVNYYCYDGYKLVGSEERTCLENQTWTGIEPKCEPFTCPPLSDPMNGRVNAGVSVNSIATYICDSGFQLEGPQRRICRLNDDWTGFQPKCVEKGCPKPKPLYNGYITGSDVKTGAIIYFKCNTGFKFVGRSRSAICLRDNKWSTEVPKCFGSCKIPEMTGLQAYRQEFFKKLIFSAQDKVEHDSSLQYYCEPGYKPSIPKTVWCFNGTWSDPGINCIKDDSKMCEIPMNPINGKVKFEKNLNPEKIEPGNVAIFLCEPDFRLMGKSKVICGPNGRWLNAFPRCVFFKPNILSCEDPGFPENGYRETWQDSMFVGSTIIFTCYQGYYMSGASNTTCLTSLKWSNPKPKCLSIIV